MIGIVIATFGDRAWSDLAWSRAYPSAATQAEEIITEHDARGPVEHVRNRAARAIKSEWLCFLDADDELAPGYVDAMVNAIGLGDPMRLLAPAVQYLYPTSEGDPHVPNTQQTMPPMNHCVVSTVVSRRLFDLAGGFDPEYHPWEDYELWLRCARLGARVVEVPSAVLRVHVNPQSDHRTLPRDRATRLAHRIHREHRRGGGTFPIEGGEAHERP